jgi:osmotically-inducible protein OsmY
MALPKWNVADTCQGSAHPCISHCLLTLLRRAAISPAKEKEEMMRSDEAIRWDVELELRRNPEIDATNITVAVKDGVVTLTGLMRGDLDKRAAAQAAMRATGVKAVANDVVVKLPMDKERADLELATAAVAVLKSRLPITFESINVTVRDGTILLGGEVEWSYQKERAEAALRALAGVEHIARITSRIHVRRHLELGELGREIQEAVERSSALDAHPIEVRSDGDRVILTGTVRSWAEREDAERAVRSTPGVAAVDNWIVISPA